MKNVLLLIVLNLALLHISCQKETKSSENNTQKTESEEGKERAESKKESRAEGEAFTRKKLKDSKDLVLGAWQLESVEGAELTDTEKSITIEFAKDGKFVQKAGEMSRKGSYEVSDDGKTITLKPEEAPEEKMNEVEVKNGKMTFKDGDRASVITLKKK
ncbi:MAG: hypothetical protein HC913_18060 [Microscillaceae bacterium]|nr:hypothetical protein [Microscillaceae bacterium]